MNERLSCAPVTGIGEVSTGENLAHTLAQHAALQDGDVLVVTSKVVSKAEGRVTHLDRATAVAQETDRVVATRGPTSIVRNRLGLVMAAAGVDESNTLPGTVVLLPLDPDESARTLREGLATETGRNVAVVVTDTFGRAWRNGQTDVAIGAAGIEAISDLAGARDGYGNLLAVTAPAVADEVAGMADLVKGKLDGVPAAVVRGLAARVLPRGEHGTGAGALVRSEAQDMFGYGAREAVIHAVVGDRGAIGGFGSPAPAGDLVDALGRVLTLDPAVTGAVAEVTSASVTVRLDPTGPGDAAQRALGRLDGRMSAVALAMGWVAPRAPRPVSPVLLRFRPATP